MLPKEAVGPLSNLQKRVEGILRATREVGDVVVTHGNSPLHITFVPPFTLHERRAHDALERDMNTFLGRAKSVHVSLVGLVSTPDMIYTRVHTSCFEPLRLLREELRFYTKNVPFDSEFTPHVSLARKFDQKNLLRIIRAFDEANHEESPFPLSFELDALTLFRKDSDIWKPERTIHFARRCAA